MRVKSAPEGQRQAILDELDFDDLGGSQSRSMDETTSPTAETRPLEHRFGLRLDSQGLLTYHGPTSIFRINATAQPLNSPEQLLPGDGDYDHVAQHFGLNLDDSDPTTTAALQQFFRWQYPNFMFIYREAFLRDHFGPRARGKYWSLPLLLAVCALGQVVPSSGTRSETSEQYYAAAESISLVSGLGKPSITNVQVFLCLAFYRIGQGDLSKGWELSGIAFRMAQDLGFQKDPEIGRASCRERVL